VISSSVTASPDMPMTDLIVDDIMAAVFLFSLSRAKRELICPSSSFHGWDLMGLGISSTIPSILLSLYNLSTSLLAMSAISMSPPSPVLSFWRRISSTMAVTMEMEGLLSLSATVAEDNSSSILARMTSSSRKSVIDAPVSVSAVRVWV